jgi:hypothetical protein
MKAWLGFLCALLAAVWPAPAQEDEARDLENAVKPAAPFPAEYSDYLILKESFSPDQKLAFIYPRRSKLEEIAKVRLFLVELQPFRVVTEVPLAEHDLIRGHGSYTVDWAKGGTAVVFVEGGKWGPEKVFAMLVREGKAPKLTDVSEEVRKQLQPDFAKSRAPRFNDNFSFIFVSEEGETWEVSDDGKVTIACDCTNDANLSTNRRWIARFTGTWDLGAGKFLKKEIKSRIETGGRER